MNIWTIAAIAFVVLMTLDSAAFYLGKRGIYGHFKQTPLGKKFYRKIHPKLKNIIHQKTLATVFLAKVTFGVGLVTFAYLGEHISYKKFFVSNFSINAFLCLLFALIANLLHISIKSLFMTVENAKNEIAIMAISLAGLLLIDHLLKENFERNSHVPSRPKKT